MKRIMLIAVALLALGLAGCASPAQVEHYPWHGPIVDPDGNPVPEPHYEAISP
jgi:hypothetical protein